MNLNTNTLGASKNLFSKFGNYRMNKQVTKTTKQSKNIKPLNESLNDSGNK